MTKSSTEKVAQAQAQAVHMKNREACGHEDENKGELFLLWVMCIFGFHHGRWWQNKEDKDYRWENRLD